MTIKCGRLITTDNVEQFINKKIVRNEENTTMIGVFLMTSEKYSSASDLRFMVLHTASNLAIPLMWWRPLLGSKIYFELLEDE